MSKRKDKKSWNSEVPIAHRDGSWLYMPRLPVKTKDILRRMIPKNKGR